MIEKLISFFRNGRRQSFASADGVGITSVPSGDEAHADTVTYSQAASTIEVSLADYMASISNFNSSQQNSALLEDIRAYNHQIVGEFNKITPLSGMRLLDIGASPHGYAMEKCFELGVSAYTGVGLDIDAPEDMVIGNSHGYLRNMNAQDLAFRDHSFDLVVSMSTFEHIADVPKALSEINRVLKPAGTVLLSFEPLWTCAYGHHLHQWEHLSRLVPSWAHLIWGPLEMRAFLSEKWPENAEVDIDGAIRWIYEEPVINRVPINQMRQFFKDSGMRVEWILPIPDVRSDASQLELAKMATGLSGEDLLTRGLSVLMHKDKLDVVQ